MIERFSITLGVDVTVGSKCRCDVCTDNQHIFFSVISGSLLESCYWLVAVPIVCFFLIDLLVFAFVFFG